MTLYLELLLIGLSLGSLYAVVALGYSMVYGVVRVINFSHGEVYAASAYFGYWLITDLDLPLIGAMVLGAVFATLLIFCVERLLFRRIGPGQRLALLIAHIGVSVALRAVLSLAFGEQFVSIRSSLSPPVRFELFGVPLDSLQVSLAATAVLMCVALWVVVHRSSFGRALRAVAEDREAAESRGFSPSTTIAGAYLIGAACAGFAAPLGAALTELTPQMGLSLGLKAFVASVLGGIGKPVGAMIAGISIGIVESLVGGLWGSAYRESIFFAVLLIALLAFPRGFTSGLDPRAEYAK